MSPRDRLLASLSPELVQAIEELVDERVRQELDGAGGSSDAALLSLADAADYLGVSVRTLERLLAKDRIPSKTIGRRRLVRRADLDAFSGDAGGRSANHVHHAAAARTLDVVPEEA